MKVTIIEGSPQEIRQLLTGIGEWRREKTEGVIKTVGTVPDKAEDIREKVKEILGDAPEKTEKAPDPKPEQKKPKKEKKATRKLDIDEEELWDEYNNRGRSVRELVQMFGCSAATIHNRLTSIQKRRNDEADT